MSQSRRSILVVGGGLFGLSAAVELQSDSTQVTLIDAGCIPRDLAASTDISKVVRMDYRLDAGYTELGEAAIAGWRAWNERFGEELYHEDGFLVLRREGMKPGGFEHDSFELLQARGHRLQRVNRERLQKCFPAWTGGGYADGYFNPTGGWAASGRTIMHLARAAKAAGVEIRENVVFAGLLKNSSRVTGVRTESGERLQADLVLMAAGAWTPVLLPHLSGVMRTTGQPVFHFKVDDPQPWQPPHFPVWAADIARTGWYGFPTLPDGTLKIANHGPGRRICPDEPRLVSPEEIDHCRRFIRESLPGLADATLVGTRLCLYCDSFDGHFWVDHDPSLEGLVVAAGDSGHAFKFAPVMGGLIADIVDGRDHPLRKRFAWRKAADSSSEGARATGG